MQLDTVSMAEKLKSPYREAFERADIYGRGRDENFDEKIMDLYDMLLEAQHMGRPVEKIVGKDIESFCKIFFQTDYRKGRSKSLRNICAIVILFIMVEFLLMTEQYTLDAFMNYETDISAFQVPFYICLVLYCLFENVITDVAFKNPKIKPVHYAFIIIEFVLVVSTVSYLLCSIYFDIPEVDVHIVWILLPATIYTACYEVVEFIKNHSLIKEMTFRNIKARREEEKELKAFHEDLRQDRLHTECTKMMAKKFETERNRYEREGRELLTQEIFAKKIRKQEGMALHPFFGVALTTPFLLITIPAIVDFFQTDEFWWGLMWSSILVFVEYKILKFGVRICKDGARIHLDILNRCEAQGIDIVTYAENVLEQTNEHGVSYE